MPRNQGTSRKGKPGKNERAVGMGKALQRAQRRPVARGNRGEGGMAMQAGMESIGIVEEDHKTKSVLEMHHLEDFLLQADLANREFETEREGLVVLDNTTQAYRGPSTVGADASEFTFTELSVPRRPSWTTDMSADDLKQREQVAFLDWRRGIAAHEERMYRHQTNVAATPFEKNIEVWRQLWRVLERSSCLMQLVDARNPLFYLSEDLREYATSLGKPMMVLINKSDYLSPSQRQLWKDYLEAHGWNPVFFSAVKEQKKLDRAAQLKRKQQQIAEGILVPLDSDDEDDLDAPEEPDSIDGCGVDVPLTRLQLLETILAFARQYDCQPDARYDNRIQCGFVGFPNVGKSSVINVLMGSSKHSHDIARVGVAAQPGKTKHFQTLLLPDSDELMLCDCPGLVFPSFVSNTADLIAAGVFPIAQMRDHWPVVNLICQRIPREIINAHYGIKLPVPTELDLNERGLTKVPPPTAEEFLTCYCISRSLLASASGVPDFTRAARVVIKDYADGKLLYCHPPPTVEHIDAFYRETVATALTNTNKRREKELLEQMKESAPEESPEDLMDDIDADMLEFLGGTAGSDEVGPIKTGNGRNKHKWGKKNRKNRNKDPYGCHSTPDEAFKSSVSGSGVVVNAGKHGKKGYTRPTSYAGVRSLG